MSDTPEQKDDLLDLDQLDNEIASGDSEGDDFLSDLNDILDDDDVLATSAQDSDEQAELEDLDALFDDFDENAAAADADAAAQGGGLDSLDDLLDLDAAEEPDDAPANEAGEVLELDEDELDLSGGDEPPAESAEAAVVDESVASAEPTADELDLFDAEAEETAEPAEAGETGGDDAEADADAAGLAAAAATVAAAATAAGGTAEPARAAAPAPAAAPSKLPLVALLVSLPALLVAGAGLFLAWSQGAQVAALEQRLAEARPATAADPRLAPALDEIAALQARVGELALLIEGPMSHLSESNETALAAIDERLNKLEAGLKAAAAPAVTRKVATTSKPAETKTEGGWVVNLISVSTQRQADEELARLKGMGFEAEIRRAKVGGQTWYRLQIPGFADYQEAKSYADKARKQGLSNAWVTKG